jgi:PAS domain S-box-containing protein
MKCLIACLLTSDDFFPHGFCYLWNKQLVWLHVISDSLIALAYLAIPLVLIWFFRQRRDAPFRWMFALFGLFIVSCGATHAMEVWNLWHAWYWLAGAVKGVTALASVGTAILLVRIAPEAVAFPSMEEWQLANAALEKEIQERSALEMDLRRKEARYREIAGLLDLTHDAIFVRGLDEKITFWNRGAERLYGWQSTEVLGKSPRNVLETAFSESIDGIKEQVLAEGQWEGELTQTCRDGRRVLVSSRWALQRNESGQPIGLLESNRDITKRRQEEKKFQALVEAAPDAMVITDKSGLIQIANSRTEELFGYAREEILGQPVEVLIPSRFHRSHISQRLDYAEHPTSRSMGQGPDLFGEHRELFGRRKDGSEFSVEVSLSPIQTPDGILIASAIRDITQRVQFERRIHEQEQKLRLFLTGVVDYAVFMLDTEGHVISWNTGAERIKGYKEKEILGQHFSVFYTPAELENDKPAKILLQARNNGRAEDEGWRVRKGGSRFWAHVLITPLHAESGRLVGFGKVTQDITRRREIEEQVREQSQRLVDTNSKLLQVNAELESFSYSVSHDLRAPLRAIDGFSLALLEDCGVQLSDTCTGHLNRIRAASQRMGMLIDDLLNLSRITRTEMHVQTVDLSMLALGVIAALERSEPHRQVQVRVESGLQAQGDPGLLRIVFENLLANAWKFTSKNSAAHIEFGKSAANGEQVYYVRDDGAGFDPVYAERLFGAFQRLHSMAEFPGTGIGLATVKRIVHRHGGRIWAAGIPGQGATFFFTLTGSGHGGD